MLISRANRVFRLSRAIPTALLSTKRITSFNPSFQTSHTFRGSTIRFYTRTRRQFQENKKEMKEETIKEESKGEDFETLFLKVEEVKKQINELKSEDIRDVIIKLSNEVKSKPQFKEQIQELQKLSNEDDLLLKWQEMIKTVLSHYYVEALNMLKVKLPESKEYATIQAQGVSHLKHRLYKMTLDDKELENTLQEFHKFVIKECFGFEYERHFTHEEGLQIWYSVMDIMESEEYINKIKQLASATPDMALTDRFLQIQPLIFKAQMTALKQAGGKDKPEMWIALKFIMDELAYHGNRELEARIHQHEDKIMKAITGAGGMGNIGSKKVTMYIAIASIVLFILLIIGVTMF